MDIEKVRRGLRSSRLMIEQLVPNYDAFEHWNDLISALDEIGEPPQHEMPFEFNVRYELHNEFRALVEKNKECKVVNVIEVISCQIIKYIIKAPRKYDKELSECAFMTFIKNPVFQTRYNGTKAFEAIAEKYIEDRNKRTETI